MLSYKTLGNGSPVIMLHGLGISFHIWKNLAPLLAKNHTLIMIEFPGIGASEYTNKSDNYYVQTAEEIDKLRKELRLDKVNLLAYSIGSKAAEAYISKYENNILKCVFLFPLFLGSKRAFLIKVLSKIDDKTENLVYWLVSECRLKILIFVIGFSFRFNKEATSWYTEIISQNKKVIRRALKDMRSATCDQKALNKVQSIRIWGTRDLATFGHTLSLNDRLIKCAHDGVVNSASEIASIVNSFLD